MGVATGMTAFFLATFVAIFVLLIDMSVTHHAPDFAIAYRRVGFPVGVVVTVLALGYLGVQWGKRMARKKHESVDPSPNPSESQERSPGTPSPPYFLRKVW